MPIFLIPTLQMAIKKLKCINVLEDSIHLEDIEELQEEMIDRFGEYPEEVDYLFQIAEMKVYATTCRCRID